MTPEKLSRKVAIKLVKYDFLLFYHFSYHFY